ncbi:hypothetical protein BLNAU_20023 [Blattamonas nauphoetae]|uniref:Uncharacterized protein n=1 Tax=Blattamonas nauphoetae TaxID=2049346 RepID=A0ABQ9X0H6_9EUKA|nr:hypothetical protein BLNAU_20023 [Blattamonas nauphoetae]
MPAPNGSTRPTLRHFPVCQPRTRAVCDRLLPSVSVPLHVDIDVVFESKLKWPCITRIQLIVNTISQFWFSETFTPPEPVAGNPLHSHTSMMLTGLSFLNSPHIRSCQTCDAVLDQQKCSSASPTASSLHVLLSNTSVPSSTYTRARSKTGSTGRSIATLPKESHAVNTHSPLAASSPAQVLLSPGSESDNNNPVSIAFGDDAIFTQRGCTHYSRCGWSLMQIHRWWMRRLIHTAAPRSSLTQLTVRSSFSLLRPRSPATSTANSPESTTSSDCPECPPSHLLHTHPDHQTCTSELLPRRVQQQPHEKHDKHMVTEEKHGISQFSLLFA